MKILNKPMIKFANFVYYTVLIHWYKNKANIWFEKSNQKHIPRIRRRKYFRKYMAVYTKVLDLRIKRKYKT